VGLISDIRPGRYMRGNTVIATVICARNSHEKLDRKSLDWGQYSEFYSFLTRCLHGLGAIQCSNWAYQDMLVLSAVFLSQFSLCFRNILHDLHQIIKSTVVYSWCWGCDVINVVHIFGFGLGCRCFRFGFCFGC